MNELRTSLTTAFLDHRQRSSLGLRPTLVLNNPPDTKVVDVLVAELAVCHRFAFSVAFISRGGLASILQPLYSAAERGVGGRILTSDYLSFTHPLALQVLLEEFPSIEVRIANHRGFHAKGYLFESDAEHLTVLLGSSNLTQAALSTNEEWNLRLVSKEEGELAKRTRNAFETAWIDALPLTKEWLEVYARSYEIYHQSPPRAPQALPEAVVGAAAQKRTKQFQLNAMQIQALERLAALRQAGRAQALVVSATGTGKTILAVKDVQRVRPKRLLFIVHRLQIASEARTVFSETLPWEVDSGIMGGGVKETEAPYLFTTINTLAKDSVLYSYSRDWFDYIIVDEVHRGAARTYQKVLQHFRPHFLLGMTATPYRSDGEDIYALFGHSLACEITLNQALEADLLVPFHYYGINALTIGGVEREQLSDFARLESQERTKRILEIIRRYSLGNTRPRGLIFVSRTQEAKQLADDLNSLGIPSQALSAADSQAEREAAFASLEAEEGLAYLVSVDVLSEGIDIPSLNQIIMLRPTKSAIVFVQQLGRGLRKDQGKEFLTVIDFIGNWQNNYLIPIALFGESSYRKDTLRKLMQGGSSAIHGASTVNFDPIARKQIYEAIDRASFKNRRFLRGEYELIKQRLGRVPMMVDFIALAAMSPLLFLEYRPTYVACKSLLDSSYTHRLTDAHLRSLAFFGAVVARGIRIQEILIIEALLADPAGYTVAELSVLCNERYGFVPSLRSMESALRILFDGFFKNAMRKKYGNITYIDRKEDHITLSAAFQALLRSPEYLSELEDLLAVGRHYYQSEHQRGRDENDLVRYQKYTRADVVRLLGWEQDDSATAFGYRVNYELQQCPIFVTYHKDSERISALIDYRDRFLSPDTFIWESRFNRTIHSKEVVAIRDPQIEKFLFVKKSDDEGIHFYYLGKLHFTANAPSSKTDESGKVHPVVMMRFALEDALPDQLYRYLITEELSEETGGIQPA
ncbi:MAG TPA: DEAD/DEAH box helicase [Sphaerochaeta sp.]|nr:DEAD/DEAH box helicase [Sphaerochaeta sp.]